MKASVMVGGIVELLAGLGPSIGRVRSADDDASRPPIPGVMLSDGIFAIVAAKLYRQSAFAIMKNGTILAIREWTALPNPRQGLPCRLR